MNNQIQIHTHSQQNPLHYTIYHMSFTGVGSENWDGSVSRQKANLMAIIPLLLLCGCRVVCDTKSNLVT